MLTTPVPSHVSTNISGVKYRLFAWCSRCRSLTRLLLLAQRCEVPVSTHMWAVPKSLQKTQVGGMAHYKRKQEVEAVLYK